MGESNLVYFVHMVVRLLSRSNPAATGTACSRSRDSGAVPQTILGTRSRCERWAEGPLGGQWEQVEERYPARDWHQSMQCLATSVERRSGCCLRRTYEFPPPETSRCCGGTGCRRTRRRRSIRPWADCPRPRVDRRQVGWLVVPAPQHHPQFPRSPLCRLRCPRTG